MLPSAVRFVKENCAPGCSTPNFMYENRSKIIVMHGCSATIWMRTTVNQDEKNPTAM